MATKVKKIRDYSEVEWDALDEKLEYPEREVECPRCGNEIIYKEIGNSISVECLSDDCIFGGLRGL